MNARPINGSLLVIVLRSRSLPNYLVYEVCASEYCIEQNLQIMRSGRVAVEIEAAGRFEDAVEFL